jgi:hypothetical protein
VRLAINWRPSAGWADVVATRTAGACQRAGPVVSRVATVTLSARSRRPTGVSAGSCLFVDTEAAIAQLVARVPFSPRSPRVRVAAIKLQWGLCCVALRVPSSLFGRQASCTPFVCSSSFSQALVTRCFFKLWTLAPVRQSSMTSRRSSNGASLDVVRFRSRFFIARGGKRGGFVAVRLPACSVELSMRVPGAGGEARRVCGRSAACVALAEAGGSGGN